jgi:hypothetical protein
LSSAVLRRISALSGDDRKAEAMTDALADAGFENLDDGRQTTFRYRMSRVRLSDAKVAREKKPPPAAVAKPVAAPAIVRPSIKINGRPLAVIADYDDLWRGIRGRVDAMGITREELNSQAKMQDGYTGKLLGPAQIKKFGIASLGKTLGAIGCKLLLVEDREATAKLMSHYKKRQRPLRIVPQRKTS